MFTRCGAILMTISTPFFSWTPFLRRCIIVFRSFLGISATLAARSFLASDFTLHKVTVLSSIIIFPLASTGSVVQSFIANQKQVFNELFRNEFAVSFSILSKILVLLSFHSQRSLFNFVNFDLHYIQLFALIKRKTTENLMVYYFRRTKFKPKAGFKRIIQERVFSFIFFF